MIDVTPRTQFLTYAPMIWTLQPVDSLLIPLWLRGEPGGLLVDGVRCASQRGVRVAAQTCARVSFQRGSAFGARK